jgi:hypothetical protein
MTAVDSPGAGQGACLLVMNTYKHFALPLFYPQSHAWSSWVQNIQLEVTPFLDPHWYSSCFDLDILEFQYARSNPRLPSGSERSRSHSTSPKQYVLPNVSIANGYWAYHTITDTFSNETRLAAADPGYWFKDIQKQGIAAFNPNPAGYKVFRNVMDYGARGD